jgi:hypothetical protein
MPPDPSLPQTPRPTPEPTNPRALSVHDIRDQGGGCFGGYTSGCGWYEDSREEEDGKLIVILKTGCDDDLRARYVPSTGQLTFFDD